MARAQRRGCTERYFFVCFPGILPCVEPLSKPRWWEVLGASGWCPQATARLLVIRGGCWIVAANSWWLLVKGAKSNAHVNRQYQHFARHMQLPQSEGRNILDLTRCRSQKTGLLLRLYPVRARTTHAGHTALPKGHGGRRDPVGLPLHWYDLEHWLGVPRPTTDPMCCGAAGERAPDPCSRMSEGGPWRQGALSTLPRASCTGSRVWAPSAKHASQSPRRQGHCPRHPFASLRGVVQSLA